MLIFYRSARLSHLGLAGLALFLVAWVQAKEPRKVYVIGDSLSTPQTWPSTFQKISGIPTFSQAIGGSKSPSQVLRAQGVELASPEGLDELAAGETNLRWHRHIADRTDQLDRKRHWPYYGAQVATPTTIEVFVDGEKQGEAERVTRAFTTDYATSPTRIFAEDHGLESGDRVTFYSDDPVSPNSDHDLTCVDSAYRWLYTSPDMPKGLVERRVYVVADPKPNSFAVKEFADDKEPLDLGSDLKNGGMIEAGWTYALSLPKKGSAVTWKSRTIYDTWIHVIVSSANDWGKTKADEVTLPNIRKLAERQISKSPRVIVVSPCFGSYGHWSPDSAIYSNYYDVYMAGIKELFPDRHIDTMELLGADRTEKEVSFLADPATPELLWISGKPSDESTWQASAEKRDGASRQWIGPGYLPLQFRNMFRDGIHWNGEAGKIIAKQVRQVIQEKGW